MKLQQKRDSPHGESPHNVLTKKFKVHFICHIFISSTYSYVKTIFQFYSFYLPDLSLHQG